MLEKKLDVLGNEPEQVDLVCFAKDSELIIGQIVEFNAEGFPIINTKGKNKPKEIIEVDSKFAIIDMV